MNTPKDPPEGSKAMEQKLGQKPGGFPPRVWLMECYMKDLRRPGKVAREVPAFSKDTGDGKEHEHDVPYISVAEHEHLVRMARAAAFEELVETTTAQAEDPGLWFQAETAAEEYVQMHLRKLHRIIESKSKAARASGNRNEN